MKPRIIFIPICYTHSSGNLKSDSPKNKGDTMRDKIFQDSNKSLSVNLRLFSTILLALIAAMSLACGVQSGDRRSAQTQGQPEEFFRPEVPAFEQFRIDLAKDEQGDCTTNETDIQVTQGQRIRLAVQLRTEDIAQGATGSIVVTGEGERDSVTYQIPNLEISSSGGALGSGVTGVNLTLEAGTRTNFDFNLANAGAFDVLCDGSKVGTITVNELSG
jgi:hypothetical protein